MCVCDEITLHCRIPLLSVHTDVELKGLLLFFSPPRVVYTMCTSPLASLQTHLVLKCHPALTRVLLL